MFKTFFNFIKNSFNWLLKSVTDLERGGLSLSRITFILSVLSAHYLWIVAIEITYYHFIFIMVNLSYILFKDRALAFLNKVMNTIAIVKGVNPTQLPKTVVDEETKEQQLNG